MTTSVSASSLDREILAVLIHAVLIHQSLAAPKRLAQLNTIAITQMRSLVGLTAIKQLSSPSKGKEKLR